MPGTWCSTWDRVTVPNVRLPAFGLPVLVRQLTTFSASSVSSESSLAVSTAGGRRSRAGRWVVVGLVLGLAGCGTQEAFESDIPVGFPTIAPAEVAGTYDIVIFAPPPGGGEDPPDFSATPTVDLDVVTGALTVVTPCNQHLGSFSLEADGRASLTITGGTNDDCPTAEGAQVLLLEVVAGVNRWTGDGQQLDLVGPGGTMTWRRA